MKTRYLIAAVIALSLAWVAAMMVLHAEPAPAAGTWCDSVHSVALAAAMAKARGVPRAVVEDATYRLPSADARLVGLGIVHVLYDIPEASHLPPLKLADLMRESCQAQERGAVAP